MFKSDKIVKYNQEIQTTLNTLNVEIIDNNEIFKTNIHIDKIEVTINEILDKNDICKYYMNIDENYWLVSFKNNICSIEDMLISGFEIYLYKDENDNSIIRISKEIIEYEQWSELYRNIINRIKN